MSRPSARADLGASASARSCVGVTTFDDGRESARGVPVRDDAFDDAFDDDDDDDDDDGRGRRARARAVTDGARDRGRGAEVLRRDVARGGGVGRDARTDDEDGGGFGKV